MNMIAKVAAMIACFTLGSSVGEAQWIAQESTTKARLRGVSAVSAKVAWASGANGTILRTVDGGLTWTPRPVAGGSDLDFRDVHAVDANTAYVLSIGDGTKSRIYKTTDGGDSWTLQHTNRDPKGFLDAIAFWDPEHGIAMGDPVDGRYVILTTDDGGKTWTKGSEAGMPLALPKEGAFAASGTCIVTQGDKNVWFGTGGGKTARVFRSKDRGKTWTVRDTPLRADSPTTGIFSLAFRDDLHGVIVGGSYDKADMGDRVAATTDDGGKTWSIVKGDEPRGFRSAAAFLGGGKTPRLIAVGPSGSEISEDGGKTWKPLGMQGFHAVDFDPKGAGWAVGEDGRIARYSGR